MTVSEIAVNSIRSTFEQHPLLEFCASMQPALLLSLLYIFPISQRVARDGITHIHNDSAFFLWSGKQWLMGEALYSEIFDVKPPGIHLVSALINAVSPSYTVAHGLAIAVQAFLVIWLVGGVGWFIYKQTDSPTAAGLAALVPFGLRAFGTLWGFGLLVKYWAAAFGLLALLLLFRETHPAVLGGVAVLPALFWQFGVGFTLSVSIAYIGRSGFSNLRQLLSYFGGGTAVVTVFLLPVLVQDSLGHFLLQVVVIPLLWTLSTDTSGAIAAPVAAWGDFWVVVFVGLAGVLSYAVEAAQTGDHAWEWFAVVVSALWFGPFGVWSHQAASSDVIPLLVVVALGIGLVVNNAVETVKTAIRNRSTQQAMTAVIVLSLIAVVSYLTASSAYAAVGWSVPNPQPNQFSNLFVTGKVKPICFARDGPMSNWWRNAITYVSSNPHHCPSLFDANVGQYVDTP